MQCIAENAPDNILRILVANKCDLHHRLVVSTQDGKQLADRYQVDFFETSAKSAKTTEISQIFDLIIEKLLTLDESQRTKTIDLSEKQSNGLYERIVGGSGCCSFTGTETEKK